MLVIYTSTKGKVAQYLETGPIPANYRQSSEGSTFCGKYFAFVLMVVELAQQLFDSEEKRRGKSTPALVIVAAHIEDIWSRC